MPGFVAPPTRLNATDGNLGFAPSRDQDRRIEDAILLGTHKFLALNEQDSDVALVFNQQVGNRSCLRNFLHGERPAADAFVCKQVFHRAGGGGEKREDGQGFVANGIAHTDFGKRDRHGNASWG